MFIILELKDLQKSAVDILLPDVIKLDDSYPDPQFEIDGFKYALFRRDRNRHAKGKMVL